MRAEDMSAGDPSRWGAARESSGGGGRGGATNPENMIAGDPSRWGANRRSQAKSGKTAKQPGTTVGDLVAGGLDLVHRAGAKRAAKQTRWTSAESPADDTPEARGKFYGEVQDRAASARERGNRGVTHPGRASGNPYESNTWGNRMVDRALARLDRRAERKAARESDAPPSGDSGWSRGGIIIAGGFAITRALTGGGEHASDVGLAVPDPAEISGGRPAAVEFAETADPFLVAEPPRELGALTITAVQLDMSRHDLAA